jgi:antitoxin FitA
MSSSKMIQIRNVPEELHRTLKARAAKSGKSLSDYLLDELRHLGERPTLRELRERIASREPVQLPEGSIADAIREEREARERHFEP